MRELVAGIDIATGHARVTIVDARGGIVASSTTPLSAPQSEDGIRVEQDAGSWWPGVCRSLQSATRTLPRSDRIVAVTPTATSGTIVLVDSRGEPLGPALLYNDRRASAEAEAAQVVGAVRWARAGLRITSSFSLAKLGWLAKSGALDDAAHAWSAADLVAARLIGSPPQTDWSHALKSGYDPVAREWASEVHNALGIREGLLPSVGAPGSVAGQVSRAAARITGLSADCEVRLGMTDSCTALIASIQPSPGRFVSVLGTTLVLKGVTDSLIVDPAGVVYSHLHPDLCWLPGGASNCGAGALAEWSGHDLGRLDRAARQHGPASVITYPLRDAGERFPFLSPTARGFWTGAPESEIDRFRAVLEGVAFVERLSYEHLVELGAVVAGPVASAGGGANSCVWNQIRATVLGRPVSVAAHAESAFGAAVLAASRTLYPCLQKASEAMVAQASTHEPLASEVDRLEDSYSRFVEELTRRGWLSRS